MKQKYLWAEWCWNRFIAMQLWLGSLAPGQGWSLFTWAFLKMQVQQGWSLGKQHCPAAADVWKHSLSPGPDPAAETGAWSCPGELKPLAESLVHCPCSRGGGCSKGESVSLGKCSRIRVMLCLRKANREQISAWWSAALQTGCVGECRTISGHECKWAEVSSLHVHLAVWWLWDLAGQAVLSDTGSVQSWGWSSAL